MKVEYLRRHQAAAGVTKGGYGMYRSWWWAMEQQGFDVPVQGWVISGPDLSYDNSTDELVISYELPSVLPIMCVTGGPAPKWMAQL
jgi:hypothetical protein